MDCSGKNPKYENVIDMEIEDNEGQAVDVTVVDDEGQFVYVIVEENEDYSVESTFKEETMFEKDAEPDITSNFLNEIKVETTCESELNMLENENLDKIAKNSKCNYFESPSCSYTSHMNSPNRKRAGESSTLDDKWTELYFFVKFDDTCLCLICHKQIYVCKKYNLERHMLSRHKDYTHLRGTERSEMIVYLKEVLEEKETHFEKCVQESEQNTETDVTLNSLNKFNVETKYNNVENASLDDIESKSDNTHFESPSSYISYINMNNRKRKSVAENAIPIFNTKWTELYFFIEVNDGYLCLICHKVISICRKYNLQRHFMSRHKNYINLKGSERSDMIDSFKDAVDKKESFFKKLEQENEQSTETDVTLNSLNETNVETKYNSGLDVLAKVSLDEIERKSKCDYFKSPSCSYVSLMNNHKIVCPTDGLLFNNNWTELYFFINFDNSCLCLICHKQISNYRKYNLERHYRSKHKDYISLTGTERSKKIDSLKDILEERQNSFVEMSYKGGLDVLGNVILDEIEGKSNYKHSSTSHMNIHRRKRAGECPTFNEKWTELYFFIQVNDGCLCLICNKKITVYKSYNLERHFISCHKSYKDLKGSERSEKIASLKDAQEKRQTFLKKHTLDSEQTSETNITLNSYNRNKGENVTRDEIESKRNYKPFKSPSSYTSPMKNRVKICASDCAIFDEKWTDLYFFVEFDDSLLCLICNDAISICSRFNVERHFASRHKNYIDLKGSERSDRIAFLKDALEKRKTFLRALLREENQ